MHKNRWIVAACLLTFASAAAQKGDIESPLFRVRSELVLLDVIIADKDGNPITDLKENELEILEDGKKQKIDYFQFLSGADSAAAEAASQGVAADPISLASPASRTSLAVFFDLASLEAPVFERAKKSLADFIQAELAPQTQVMLATYRVGMEVRQPFTDDKSKLLEALEAIQPAPEAQSALASFGQFSKQLEELFHGAVPGSEPAAMAATQGKSFVVGLQRQMAAVSSALTAFCQSLRPLPGRKQVLLYSSGYPMQPMSIVRQLIDKRTRANYSAPRNEAALRPGPDGTPALPDPLAPDVLDTRGAQPTKSSVHKERMAAILSGGSGVDMGAYLQEVIDEANRSQVSFYSVDARGLVASSGAGGAGDRGLDSLLGSEYVAELRDAVTRAPQAFLTDLASNSGGLSFLNSNDLSSGLNRAQADARSYYLVAYRPKNKRKEGKFHTIDVKLKRSGAQARHRQGYLEGDPEKMASDDVMTALRYPDLFSAYPIEVQVQKAGPKLTFNTIAPTSSLVFLEDKGMSSFSVEIYGILVDSQGKWVGENLFFSRGQQLGSITAERKAQFLTNASFSLSAEADPPPAGDYQLVVVIRQGADGTVCAHRQPLEVGG